MREDRKSGFFKPGLEKMSRDERAAYLGRRLEEIVKHAFERAPAVRKRFGKLGINPGDIRGLSDLERLPVLKKPELIEEQRNSLPFGGFCGLEGGGLGRIYVSPGPIYEPGETVETDERWLQALHAGGFRAGDIAQITFNFNLVPVSFWLDSALQRLGCVTVPAGAGNTELQVRIMKELGVTGYLGTPSFLSALGDRAEEIGLDPLRDLRLEVGFVAAEPLPESLRTSIEARFGMIVRQSYGTADVGCLGFECFEKSGMHFPDECIVEVVNPESGRPVGPGETGEVVATVFDRAYPLIRFGTGDLSYYTDGPCGCGRTSARLVKILGRLDQMTKVRGLFIHPGQVDEIGKRFQELGRCQVRVFREANRDRMVFRAETEGSVDVDGLRTRVGELIQEVMRVKGEVEFLPPGSISPDDKKIDDRRKWD